MEEKKRLIFHAPELHLRKEDSLLQECDKFLWYLNKKYPEAKLLQDDEFEVTFALTKAEFSELTREEAKEIYEKYQNTSLTAKEFFDTLPENEEIQKKHDKVEYFNILKTIVYIRKDNQELYNKVKSDWIKSELLLKLHNLLTDSLDDLFLDKWVKHYSPYFQGTFRDKDNVVVGWMRPGRASNIPNVLDDINKSSKEVKTIEDIFRIHQDMYRAHLFFNGNKRICRCVEIILNNRYRFLKYLPLSVWNYFNHDRYLSALVWYCFSHYNRHWFAKYSFSLLFTVFVDKIYNFILFKLRENWYSWSDFLSEDIIEDFLVKKEKKIYSDKEQMFYLYRKAFYFFTKHSPTLLDHKEHLKIKFNKVMFF